MSEAEVPGGAAGQEGARTGGDEEGAVKADTAGADGAERDFAKADPAAMEEALNALLGGRNVIYAPHGNINTGSVQGGQHVRTEGAAGRSGGGRVEAHEGPISVAEIMDARSGFAEPGWFPEALRQLDGGLLFLYGDSGTGRRTAALNLLFRHSGGSLEHRALDSDEDLATWRPTDSEARGYLVYGLLPQALLRPGAVAKLQDRLRAARARMVIVVPGDRERVRPLSRELHLTPVHGQPPAPRAVFDARLEVAVPDPQRRVALLAHLEDTELSSLLAPELVPAQVVELVNEIAKGDRPSVSDLRARLSFLAEDEVPELLDALRDDPDGLAFLLAVCVFEGLDHRLVREEAARLLRLADGRLAMTLPVGGDGEGKADKAGPNPAFVFRRSLDDMLRSVRAECAPVETRRSGSGYYYSVEPVRFTRHRQAEAVLRYVWRQYGELSALLTGWMEAVPHHESELAVPVGQVMGSAARWGGGRRALGHILQLATSSRANSRSIAAFALGIAAQDPLLAGEIKYHLRRWSAALRWQPRWTAAVVCSTDFGTSRPELALALLQQAYRGHEGDEYQVGSVVLRALLELFAAGNQSVVFDRLEEWARSDGRYADLARRAFPQLLWADQQWFREQLLTVGEHTEAVVGSIHGALDDEDRFDLTCGALVGWCRTAVWDEGLRGAVQSLLSALAQDMSLGVFRLFVEVDGDEDIETTSRLIAREALEAWRGGQRAHAYGGSHDERRA
ncbi:hypothetical protein ACIA8O_01770 [Kitasatospora sp. NPDC051853]|uniref:hypothetical protein n=1 Tax=Kitasatospora sp. NPDC051853 TaxID=3364058 RepID=UPI0037A78A98